MGTGEEGDMLARRALAAADDVESCMALDDPDRVSWAEPGTVAWAPVDVSWYTVSSAAMPPSNTQIRFSSSVCVTRWRSSSGRCSVYPSAP